MSTTGGMWIWEPGKEPGVNPRNWHSGFPVPTEAEDGACEHPEGTSKWVEFSSQMRPFGPSGLQGLMEGEGTDICLTLPAASPGRLACSQAVSC